MENQSRAGDAYQHPKKRCQGHRYLYVVPKSIPTGGASLPISPGHVSVVPTLKPQSAIARSSPVKLCKSSRVVCCGALRKVNVGEWLARFCLCCAEGRRRFQTLPASRPFHTLPPAVRERRYPLNCFPASIFNPLKNINVITEHVSH